MSKGRSAHRWVETPIVLGALACLAAAVRLAWAKSPGSYVTVVLVAFLALVVLGTLSGLLLDLVGKLGPLRPVAGLVFGGLLFVAGAHAALVPDGYVTPAGAPGEHAPREPTEGHETDPLPEGGSAANATRDPGPRLRSDRVPSAE